jgi:hypothetical protein
MISSVTRRTSEIEDALDECLKTADTDVVFMDGERFLRVFVPGASECGLEVPLIPLRRLARDIERFLS